MMKSLFHKGLALCACLAACLLVLSPGRALAGDIGIEDFYLGYYTGYAAPHTAKTWLPFLPAGGDVDYGGDVTFSGVAGFGYSDHVRLEGEVNYRNPWVDSAVMAGVPVAASGDITSWSLMFNTYYDFRPDERLNPFINAGVGAAYHHADLDIGGTTASGHDVTFAYSAGAGLAWAVNDHLSLTGGYRYIDTGNPDFGAIRTETKAHEFRLGLTFKFHAPKKPYRGR